MRTFIFLTALLFVCTGHAQKHEKNGGESELRCDQIQIMGLSVLSNCQTSNCHLTYAANEDGASSLVTLSTKDGLTTTGCANTKLGKDAFGRAIKLPANCSVGFRMNSQECRCEGDRCVSLDIPQVRQRLKPSHSDQGDRKTSQ